MEGRSMLSLFLVFPSILTVGLDSVLLKGKISINAFCHFKKCSNDIFYLQINMLTFEYNSTV
jgi:hypothetical protein